MNIGIVGCNGRVGKTLIEELLSGKWEERGLKLAGGADHNILSKTQEYFTTQNPEELFERSDVIIDFTSPEGTVNHARLAQKYKTAIVIGTTGLTVEDEKTLQEVSKHTPIVYAANMSIGINLLLALVEKTAAQLSDDWDIEIFESHHKHKVDAPSGTALALGKAAAAGRGNTLENTAQFERHGNTGAREKGEIGFSVVRGGDIVGEHNVMFLGQGERLELCHKASNRTLFARGALRAAHWIKDKQTGLYSMRDVLDL